MPRIGVVGDSCLKRPRLTQGCRADDDDESSLSHSPVPATCLYPEPDQSNPLHRSYQTITPGQRPFWKIRNRMRCDGAELLAPRPNSKLKDYPLSAVRDCLFDIFAATLHIGDRSSIRNLRTRHVVVTGTNLLRKILLTFIVSDMNSVYSF